MISSPGALRVQSTIFNRKKFQAVLLYLLAHSPRQMIEGKKKLSDLSQAELSALLANLLAMPDARQPGDEPEEGATA